MRVPLQFNVGIPFSAPDRLFSFSLILASQSPRRTELLTQAGIAHGVRAASILERREDGETARRYVERLAHEKASAGSAGEREAILGADTVVVLPDGPAERIFEKPRDRADALGMLTALQGRSHLVLTGVCLKLGDSEWTAVERTEVRFAPMTSHEIETYVESGEPFDKAGGYAIQGIASRYVEAVNGCYFNVVGLPLRRVYELLLKAESLSQSSSARR